MFFQDGDQRLDLRDLIFREVVGNVIIHREYMFLLQTLDINISAIDETGKKHLSEIPINPELNRFENKTDFMAALIGTIGKNEGKLSGIKLLKGSLLTKSSLIKKGTSDQIEGNLFTKKGNQLLCVLIGLIDEMTLEEVMHFTGFESKESFRENYLKKLRKNDLVALTIPDIPNDPNQKYIITDKGKMLLGGIDI